MSFFVFNTLTQKKEEFISRVPGHVSMYSCGPTVYDFLHVGNFRGVVFYNFLRNYLESLGYQVKFVYNVTDIDDRIIARALKENRSASEVANHFTEEFLKDFAALELRPHSSNPKVSESMPTIIGMIEKLVSLKKAYVSQGDVFFSINDFENYGKLSHRKSEELEVAVRSNVGDHNDKKQHPLDFALWKKAKAGEPGYPSPWSEGKPGWHIECSAMIEKELGDEIDIHGGGIDLIFPHHENEIAQSESCSQKPLARYWIHHNMLEFGGAKMSKSLGNIRTARGFAAEFSGEVLKFILLNAHYRSPIDFSEESISHQLGGLSRIYSAMALAENYAGHESISEEAVELKNSEWLAPSWKKIEAAFADDLNTALAITSLFEVTRLFNSQVKWGLPVKEPLKKICQEYLAFARSLGSYLSLFEQKPAEFLRSLDLLLAQRRNIDPAHIDRLVEERSLARSQKNFVRADEIRAELSKLEVSVYDRGDGSRWEMNK